MSSASPDDLAVTFRSIPRRLREAQGDADASVTAAATAELRGLLHEASRLLACGSEPDDIAGAVLARRAEEWTNAELDRLREIALDLGRLLRHIATLAES